MTEDSRKHFTQQEMESALDWIVRWISPSITAVASMKSGAGHAPTQVICDILGAAIERWEAAPPTSAKSINETEIDRVRAALKIAEQALLEVQHAQGVGANWYTRGEKGLYQQVAMWVRRGQEAISKAKASTTEKIATEYAQEVGEPPRDVVARLRAVADFGGTHLEGLWSQAADEIERLRSRIAEMAAGGER